MTTFAQAHEFLPVRCYSCGKVLARKKTEQEYIRRVYVEHEKASEVLDDLTTNLCCRMSLMSMPVSKERIQEVMEEYTEQKGKGKRTSKPKERVLETEGEERQPIFANVKKIISTSTLKHVDFSDWEGLRVRTAKPKPVRLEEIDEYPPDAEQYEPEPKEKTPQPVIVPPKKVRKTSSKEKEKVPSPPPSPKKKSRRSSLERVLSPPPSPKKSRKTSRETSPEPESPPKKSPKKAEPESPPKKSPKKAEPESPPKKSPKKTPPTESSIVSVKVGKKKVSFEVGDEATRKAIESKSVDKLTVAQLTDFLQRNKLTKPAGPSPLNLIT